MSEIGFRSRERVAGTPQTVAAARIVPAIDQRAEAEADQVADDVVARIGARPDLRPAGDRLPEPLAAALTTEVGSVGHVRVHDDPLASKLAASIHARAFAAGSDVYLARGEGGAQLLAHEAAHAALHPQPAADVVHAKLAGTHDVLRGKGGGESTGRLSRLLRRHWIRLLRALDEYERIEANVVAGTAGLPNVRTKMLKLLDVVEDQALAWQHAHGGADRGEQARQAGTKLASDPGAKAARAQAIAMLLPRVRDERRAHRNGTWTDTLSLNPSTVAAQGRADKGALNSVQELRFDVGGGESFSGYFKADKGFVDKPQAHELEVGISQVDPQYGARSVAMSRLDELFGTNVLVRTEFATYAGAMGTVGEVAEGTKPQYLRIAITEQERKDAGRGADYIALEDPTLQQQLNHMQILDAICGQLDRHIGNYYIQTDQTGKVIRVTGIDLDMAFGKEQKSGAREDSTVVKAHNYIGMPPLVDERLGLRILEVTDREVRKALAGLLSSAEVDATVSRLKWVREQVRALAAEDLLIRDWDLTTVESTHGAWDDPVTSYLAQLGSSKVQDLRAGGRTEMAQKVVAASYNALVMPLPEETKRIIGTMLGRCAQPLDELYWQGNLTPAGMREIIDDLLELLATKRELIDRIVIGVQEGDGVAVLYPLVGPTIEPMFQGLIADRQLVGV